MIAGILTYDAYNQLTARPTTDTDVIVKIPEGQGFLEILDTLKHSGVQINSFYTYLYAGGRGIYSRIQAGTYAISAGETAARVLDKLARGEVIVRKLTIIEGWTLSDILNAMKHNPYIRIETDDPAELANRLGVTNLEGWIYPDTYEFHDQTSNVELLRRGHKHMRELLKDIWARRSLDIPLETPYQALVLASIIEKETSIHDERARIAGVFLTRLKRKMRLQSDPTVIYGMGERFDGNISAADLRQNTPYNTYKINGLPPTPIAMPGAAALQAAVNPEFTGDIYFVSKRDGTHYFSKNYEDHRSAVKKYQ